MSMQRGVPKIRPAGTAGKLEDATPVVESQSTKVKGMVTSEWETSEPVAPVAKRVEERQAARNMQMDHLERRLYDICSLLENLMINRGGGSYYGGQEGMPLPMTGGTWFKYQELSLFSMPSRAVRRQASSAGIARTVPGRA
ncbi:hypothetical protein IW150_000386, partial [Coemansia sp. RSA 2607]